LQATYLIEQDRILVRLNTSAGEELRLWLTRRMAKNLFGPMMEASTELIAAQTPLASHDGADHKTLLQFQKQASLQQADFSTPFQSQALVLPIGEEPLLATAVHIKTGADSALHIGFEENIPGVATARSFEITLGDTLLHGFLHLLESALGQSGWDLTLGEVDEPNQNQLADAFASAVPPRYLN